MGRVVAEAEARGFEDSSEGDAGQWGFPGTIL